MATNPKKTIDDLISATEAAIKKQQAKLDMLKAKKTGSGALTKESPGMIELFAAMKKVSDENSCNNIEVVRAVIRMKKLPVRIEVTPKKPRDTAEKKPVLKNSRKSNLKKPTLDTLIG